MLDDRQESDGACHCGTVRFHVRLSDSLRTARRCDCSFCGMRGAIAVSARLQDFTVLAGAEALALYEFNTHTAKHYFCSKCGIYTHHQRRSNPDEVGVNVACLTGLSPFDFTDVAVNNGRQHPSDHPNKPAIAGVLHYTPTLTGLNEP